MEFYALLAFGSAGLFPGFTDEGENVLYPGLSQRNDTSIEYPEVGFEVRVAKVQREMYLLHLGREH